MPKEASTANRTDGEAAALPVAPRLRPLVWCVGLGALAASALFIGRTLDASALARTWSSIRAEPVAGVPALLAYAAAFLIRAALWRRLLPELPTRHALAALHVSLAANHVLPLRLGEALRPVSVARRARLPLAAAAASTLVLRAADAVAAAALALVLTSAALGAGAVALGAVAGIASGLWAAGLWWLRRMARSKALDVRASPLVLALGATAAWILESGVLWQACRWAGADVSPAQAVGATAIAVLAQAVAIAPAGLGTYEAAAGVALASAGAEPGAALAAALTAHALKTAYALLAGAVALFLPEPGLLGRLRLASGAARERKGALSPPPGAEVVLVLPAHDEGAAVAGVVGRTPDRVCGRGVSCLVVDDGSSDGTREAAVAAGARVISLGHNAGLGAAVRRGLREALARRPAAIAFCDADGEYAPEELERLVAPILAGRADYVVGSRFAGAPRRMLPHRWLGNVVFTRALSVMARRRITDGQSGYRALSPEAAARAEIIHDFNYAQVLTLDLLAKGFRYLEVPISYRFRASGRSFVKLGRYLRRVVPAVYRELNLP